MKATLFKWKLAIVNVRLLVFDLLLILFRVALWPNCWERAVPLAFHLTVLTVFVLLLFFFFFFFFFFCVCVRVFFFFFFFSAVLFVRVPFPFGVLDTMWNSIVSVPDHRIFIYLASRIVFKCLRHIKAPGSRSAYRPRKG